MDSRKVTDKADLRKLLAAISVGADGLLLAGQQLDLYRTYEANCKDAPALPLMVLPGFGPSALARGPDGALLGFNHFCCSQFGQRNCFRFIFFDALRDSGYRLVRATFCSAAAADYTSHARANGQHDRYAAIRAGDIVDLLCVDGDWSFVRSYYHAVPHVGWVPTAYLGAQPI